MTDIDTEKAHILHGMLAGAQKPAIVTHTRPDGDAIGSSTAMYHFLLSQGKAARIILTNPAPANLDFLTEGAEVLIHESDKEAAEQAIMDSDLIICLDFNAFHRTDSLESVLKEAGAEKILIDHHLSPDTESFRLIFSEQEVSSASELLYHILMMLPETAHDASRLPSKAAEALMTGMTTDTNNFANSVYPSTFLMASELIKAGVDRDGILGRLYNRFKESRIRLQGHILKDLMQTSDNGVAYITLDSSTIARYNVREGDTEGFVNIPLSIDRISLSIFAKEDNGYARISIRSKRGTSANMCARRYFNGGGHENAAGGRLYFGKDIPDFSHIGKYIEKVTNEFMQG